MTLREYLNSKGIRMSNDGDVVRLEHDTDAMAVVAAVAGMACGATPIKFRMTGGGKLNAVGAWATARPVTGESNS